MILTIALAMMTPADPGGWVLVSRNRQYTSYVDVRSVSVIGTRRRARQRVVLARAEPRGTVTAEYRVEVSCEARQIAMWEAVEYDRRGRIVGSRRHSQPPVQAILPGSVGEGVLDFLCKW